MDLENMNEVDRQEMKLSEFRRELQHLLNRESMEGRSDTPDFILADFLTDCLEAFDTATKYRDKWHGFVPFGRDEASVGLCGASPPSDPETP